MSTPPSLAIVILAVTDLPRAAAFWRAVTLAQSAVEVPVYVELELPGATRLGLYAREGFARNVTVEVAPPPRAGATSTELYLRCDDLDAIEARLRAAGAPCLSPRAERPWGDLASYWADPDGNVVVAARPISAPAAG